MKIFLINIRPTVPLTKVPLIRPKGLTKGGGVLFFDIWGMFPPKRLIFFHQKFYIPTPHTHNILSIIPCVNQAQVPFTFHSFTCTDCPCSRSTRPPPMATPRSQPCRSCPLASSPGRLRIETITAATTVQIAAAFTGPDSGHPEDPRRR